MLYNLKVKVNVILKHLDFFWSNCASSYLERCSSKRFIFLHWLGPNKLKSRSFRLTYLLGVFPVPRICVSAALSSSSYFLYFLSIPA